MSVHVICTKVDVNIRKFVLKNHFKSLLTEFEFPFSFFLSPRNPLASRSVDILMAIFIKHRYSHNGLYVSSSTNLDI